MSFLSLEGVSKRFDDVTAVDRVSFAVDRGEVVGFLGPNGAGKSTTMRLITQYYEPDTGEIRLDGLPLAAAARAAKRRIGYLPETIRCTVTCWCRNTSRSSRICGNS